MTLYIHPQTKKMLDAVLTPETHAVILTGEEGVGLATITAEIALRQGVQRYTVLPEKDEKVDIEKGTITVQSIRRLYDLTKTIEPNGRLIVIDYAERMGIPAQNAFLKLLEEPVKGVRFVLLTHQPSSLLPTIRSRSQTIRMRLISTEQSNALLDELKVTDPTKRAQLLFIAGGRPAELTRLVQNESYFADRAQIVKDAREFITGSLYSRLVLANKYKNNRNDALLLLEDASKMLRKSLADGGSDANIKSMQRLDVVHKRLTEQGNVRLQLSSAIIL